MRSGTESVKAALLDTNILTAYLTPNHPSHQFVIDEILALRHRGYQLWVAPQCLYELWAVLTRPIEANGFGRTPEEADQALERVRADFIFREDPPGIVDEWRRLCVAYQIVGKRAHDARIVAYMRRHGIAELLTLNGDDFQTFASREDIRFV